MIQLLGTKLLTLKTAHNIVAKDLNVSLHTVPTAHVARSPQHISARLTPPSSAKLLFDIALRHAHSSVRSR